MFSFSRCPEKMVIPKKSHRNTIFLVLSGKMMFFPPKISFYSLGEKWKMIFVEKNTWKYDIFFRCSEKMVFSKKLYWNMIFLVSPGKLAFFLPKTWYYSFGRKMKDDPSQEIHGNMIFSVYTHRYYKHGVSPLCQKKSKMIFPSKKYA